ncbi:MAG: ERCC4 domain-containing protein [Desulfobacteraceae bacterium]|jgi:ERCC4-type nuclease|nr:ERCC4 domain-containing protein [Desulfobacteraceae bacterium]
MKSPVFITADDREAGSGVIEALEAIEGVQVRVERLSLGDYQVGDQLLFERKTLADFALSVIDGRLFRQAVRLANASRHGALLLEGTGRDLPGTGVRREALTGALVTVSLILGIPVLRSCDPAESARVMVFAARQVQTAVAGGIQRPGRRPRGRRQRQIYILQGLPGLGPTRAARLLDHFGNVQAVMCADVQALSAVDGIGAATARQIRSAVAEAVAPYGIIDLFPV